MRSGNLFDKQICPSCKVEKFVYQFTEYNDKCGECSTYMYKCEACGKRNKVSEERVLRNQIPFCRYCFSTELREDK